MDDLYLSDLVKSIIFSFFAEYQPQTGLLAMHLNLDLSLPIYSPELGDVGNKCLAMKNVLEARKNLRLAMSPARDSLSTWSNQIKAKSLIHSMGM